jgi:hypothetical protein
MNMRRLPFLIATVLVLLFAASEALACECVEYPTNRRAFRDARAVFIGTPVSSWISQPDYDVEGPDMFITAVRLMVEKSWKGVKTSEVTILSDSSLELQQTCGVGFTRGERYLIYAYGDELKAMTFCGRDVTPVRAGDESAVKRLKQLGSFWFRAYAGLNPF